MAKSQSGLPIGIALDGLWNSDQLLLKIALVMEKLF